MASGGYYDDLGSAVPIPCSALALAFGKPWRTTAQIDSLVNNAGIIRRDAAVTFSEADWGDVMDVNLKSPFFLRHAL